MHERLTQLRNPYEEGLRWPKQPREAARLDASYDEAFREYLGSDPADAGPEAAIALAASRDPVGLAVAIDHWALVRDSREGERDAAFDARTARLRRLAASVDGEDPWRNDLRSLLPDVESNREALQDLARTARLSELPPISIVLLGEALWAAEARDDAVAVYRRGRELHPGDFGISLRLARMLYDVDDHRLLPEVIDVLHSARALRSFEHEIAHLEIVVLHRMGRYDDAQRLAEDTFQLVLARKWPWEDALAHRAWALAKLERWEDLIEVNRRRLEILESEEKPVLGHVVGALDSTVEALEALGRLDEAIATARRGLEVVAVYEAAVEAGEQQPHERAADAEETFNEAIERIDARREELPVLEAILDGRRAAGSPEQALAAADVAYVRRHFELSVRTMARVFVEQPGSEADHRFEAACRAALCGTGRGEDAAALDPTEREAWRRQALAWLRAELDAERERGVRAPRGTASRLEGWRTDPDLAGIRDESELAALPHEERGALRELWADVEVLAANLSDPP
jgi:tetratricopeptide (TPR) repeat protein